MAEKLTDTITKHKQLTHEAFVLKAIKSLRPEGRMGIHTVYTGFNEAFRQYFPGEDPVAAVNALVTAGKVESRFCRGGAIIYLPGEAPKAANKGGDALKKILD